MLLKSTRRPIFLNELKRREEISTDKIRQEMLVTKATSDLLRLHQELTEKIEQLEKFVIAKITEKNQLKKHVLSTTEKVQSDILLFKKEIESLKDILEDLNNEHIKNSEHLSSEVLSGKKYLEEQIESFKNIFLPKEKLDKNIKSILKKKNIRTPQKYIDYLTDEDVSLFIEKVKEYFTDEKLLEILSKKLKAKDVDGLEQTLHALQTQLKKGYLHGGGVPSLSAGTGITLTPKADGGFTVSTTATSVGYQEPTGTVNGSNQTFVFATAPNVIVVDGLTLRKTQSDSTVNWTGTDTIVLSVAPNFEIYGVA